MWLAVGIAWWLSLGVAFVAGAWWASRSFDDDDDNRDDTPQYPRAA